MGNVIFWDIIQGEWGGRNTFLNEHNEHWYSTKGYTELTIYFAGGYSGEDPKFLKAKSFREVRHWMESTLRGEVIIKYPDSSGGFVSIIGFFQYEDDAALFKLTWLNSDE